VKQTCKQCIWLADRVWRQLPSHAAPVLHTFDTESFWINTGLSGKINNRNNKNDLEQPRPGQTFKKTQTISWTPFLPQCVMSFMNDFYICKKQVCKNYS